MNQMRKQLDGLTDKAEFSKIAEAIIDLNKDIGYVYTTMNKIYTERNVAEQERNGLDEEAYIEDLRTEAAFYASGKKWMQEKIADEEKILKGITANTKDGDAIAAETQATIDYYKSELKNISDIYAHEDKKL